MSAGAVGEGGVRFSEVRFSEDGASGEGLAGGPPLGDDRRGDGPLTADGTGPARMCRVGHVDLIPPGEGRTFRVDGEEVAVFRTRDGRLFALQAACSHAGGPLADGLIGDGRVLCPLHGFAFALETGEPIRHECPALRRYRVVGTDAGEILVGMP